MGFGDGMSACGLWRARSVQRRRDMGEGTCSRWLGCLPDHPHAPARCASPCGPLDPGHALCEAAAIAYWGMPRSLIACGAVASLYLWRRCMRTPRRGRWSRGICTVAGSDIVDAGRSCHQRSRYNIVAVAVVRAGARHFSVRRSLACCQAPSCLLCRPAFTSP